MVRIALSLVLVLVALAFAGSAFAIGTPDSMVIGAVDWYCNCATEGDALIVIQYYVHYATLPAEHMSDAFIFRLRDNVGTLAATTSYDFYNYGYGRGIVSMYLSGTYTYEGDYKVVLSGNPALSWTSGVPQVESTNITWHDECDSLGNKVLSIADNLSKYWTDVVLVSSGPAGYTLTSTGAHYFTMSIPHLQDMAPGIFSGYSIPPEFESDEFDDEYFWSTSLEGTEIEDNFQKLADALHLPVSVTKVLLWMVPTLMIGSFITLAIRDPSPIPLLILPMLPAGYLAGMLPIHFTVVVGLLATIAAAYIIYYRTASG